MPRKKKDPDEELIRDRFQDEQEEVSENAQFWTFAWKTFTHPELQNQQREKYLKRMNNSTPSYVKEIMDASKPTIGREDGLSASLGEGFGGMGGLGIGEGGDGLLSHLSHIFRIKKGKRDDAMGDYMPRNHDNPSRVMPIYALEPQFKVNGVTPQPFFMDFNDIPRQTIGRNFSCDVNLTPEYCNASDLKLISRGHCAFVANKGGGLRIQDTSQNGTLVNGDLLMKDVAKCYPGDVLTIGGEKSKAAFRLTLMEMGYSGPVEEKKPVAIQYRSIEEVREEMEEEIESIPDRELPWFKVPEIQAKIIKGGAMEAMMHVPNVEMLWENLVDCDTIMAAQAFRKFGFGTNPYMSLHGAAGMNALAKDWVGINHLVTQGCVSALLHQVEVALSRTRSLALQGLLRMMDSADARATLHRDGGIEVLERMTQARIGPRMSPNFREVARMVLERARIIDHKKYAAINRPHTALPAGRVYFCPPGRPYTPFGRRMRQVKSATPSVMKLGGRGGMVPSFPTKEVDDDSRRQSMVGSDLDGDDATPASDSQSGRVAWQDQTLRPDCAVDRHLDRPWSAAEIKTRPLSAVTAPRPASAEQQILQGRPPPAADGVLSLRAKAALEEQQEWLEDEEDERVYEEETDAWEDEDDEEIYLKNLEEDGEDLHDEKDSANTSPLSALGTNVKPYLEGGAYSRLHSAAPSGTRRPVTPSFKLESIVEREHEHSSLGPDGFMDIVSSAQSRRVSVEEDPMSIDLLGPMSAQDLDNTPATRRRPLSAAAAQPMSTRPTSAAATRPITAQSRVCDGVTPALSRPISAVHSVDSSEASALPTRVGTPARHDQAAGEADHSMSKGGRRARPVSAAPSRAGSVQFSDMQEGDGGRRGVFVETAAEAISESGDGDPRHSSVPDSRQGSRPTSAHSRSQSAGSDREEYKEASAITKEIFDMRLRLRQMEVLHRKQEGQMETNIAELQAKLQALRGGSFQGDDVADLVIPRNNSRPGTAERVRCAVTASRHSTKEASHAPPIPVVEQSNGAVPRMHIAKSLGEEELEASLKHGASNNNYTVALVHSGEDPFALTHIHSSDSSLFPDVRAAVLAHKPVAQGKGRRTSSDDSWEEVDHRAVTPQKEVVRQFEALSDHEQRSLLQDFADRFWAEFLCHQGTSKFSQTGQVGSKAGESY